MFFNFFQKILTHFRTRTRFVFDAMGPLICENKNFGAHVCVTHGWKGLEVRNTFCKRTYALKLILEGLMLKRNFVYQLFICIPDSLKMPQFAPEMSDVNDRPAKMFARLFLMP